MKKLLQVNKGDEALMEFKEFSKKYKCAVSRYYESRPLFHNRPIERKTYIIYKDIRTMLPFSPQTNEDCLNCLSFSSDLSSEDAKRKAYDFIKGKGSLDALAFENTNIEVIQK